MTPVEALVRARGLGITFRLDEAGEVLATLPEDMPEAPAWLSEAKREEPEGFAFAVLIGAAVERGGGDVRGLLTVTALEFEGVQ